MDTSLYTVYSHTNKTNGKQYFGITCQKPERRWGYNGNNYEECPHFWRAIQKYGWNNFEHNILYTNLTHQEACDMEISLISEHQTTNPDFGYNVSKGGDGLDADYVREKWKDEEFKTYASHCMKQAWLDPEKRERRSEAAQLRWTNDEFRNKVTDRITEICGKSVTCVETGEIYATRKEASEAHNVCGANISRAIKTGYKCGGYHWKYTDDVS